MYYGVRTVQMENGRWMAEFDDFRHCWRLKEINDVNLHVFHSFHPKIDASEIHKLSIKN